MSEQYTISAVSERTREYGDKVVYYVKLEEAQADVPAGCFELHQKDTSKAPTEGLKIDVKTFQRGEYQGTPFVKIIKDFSNKGGGSSQGGSDERGESIERQVAAKVAGGMAAALAHIEHGVATAVAMDSAFEAFFDTVLRKIQGGPAGSGGMAQNGGGEVPADMEGLQPAAAAGSDEQIPF